jgi:hypothetical protein
VGPPGINVHDWEVCDRESQITVSSDCLDTSDQIVYVAGQLAALTLTTVCNQGQIITHHDKAMFFSFRMHFPLHVPTFLIS